MLNFRSETAADILRNGYSPYLDIVRLLAALQVFLMHAANHGITRDWLGFLIEVQSDAVLVFFVLSGLVIAYVSDVKERSVSLFMSERMARLWSVALPALLLSLLVEIGVSNGKANWHSYVASAVFMNQAVFGHYEPKGNPPIWSLSYEFWYYVLFAGAFLMKGVQRVIALLVSAVLAGPNILLLFPVWLVGVVAYRASTVRLPKAVAWLMFVVPLIIYAAFMAISARQFFDHQTQLLIGSGLWYELQSSKRFIYYFILGAMIAIHFVGASHVLRNAFTSPQIRRAISAAANCTFALYLFHYPLILLINAAGLTNISSFTGLLVIAAIVGVVLLLTDMTDRLKAFLRSVFIRLSVRTFGNAPASVGAERASAHQV